MRTCIGWKGIDMCRSATIDKCLVRISTFASINCPTNNQPRIYSFNVAANINIPVYEDNNLRDLINVTMRSFVCSDVMCDVEIAAMTHDSSTAHIFSELSHNTIATLVVYISESGTDFWIISEISRELGEIGAVIVNARVSQIVAIII